MTGHQKLAGHDRTTLTPYRLKFASSVIDISDSESEADVGNASTSRRVAHPRKGIPLVSCFSCPNLSPHSPKWFSALKLTSSAQLVSQLTHSPD